MLGQSSPAQFYVHVPAFINIIPSVITDSKNVIVRLETHSTLSVCLEICTTRHSINKKKWFQSLFDLVRRGSKPTANNDGIVHGAMLTLDCLLLYAKDFIVESLSFDEVWECVNVNLNHKDKFVRKTVMGLLPKLANVLKNSFTKEALQTVLDYLLTLISKGTFERPTALSAVGAISDVNGNLFLCFNPIIIIPHF